MQPGGEVTCTIPAKYAYGEKGICIEVILQFSLVFSVICILNLRTFFFAFLSLRHDVLQP